MEGLSWRRAKTVHCRARDFTRFANRDQSEAGFLIPVQKCVQTTTVAWAVPTRAVRDIRKKNRTERSV